MAAEVVAAASAAAVAAVPVVVGHATAAFPPAVSRGTATATLAAALVGTTALHRLPQTIAWQNGRAFR